jgi:hypothetical protein
VGKTNEEEYRVAYLMAYLRGAIKGISATKLGGLLACQAALIGQKPALKSAKRCQKGFLRR